MKVVLDVCKNVIESSRVVEFYATRTKVKDLYIGFPKRDEIQFIYKGEDKTKAVKTWKDLFKENMEAEGYDVRYKGDKVVIKEVIVI